jgi:hypothetical protein
VKDWSPEEFRNRTNLFQHKDKPLSYKAVIVSKQKSGFGF